MRVVGIRGAFIGLVGEVRDDALLLEPDGDAQPYWLRLEAVIGVDGNRVELICDSSEVSRYIAFPSED